MAAPETAQSKFVIHHSIHTEVPIENSAYGSKGQAAFDHAREKRRNIGGDRFFVFISDAGRAL